MQDLLTGIYQVSSKVFEVMAANPGATVTAVIVGAFVALIWGVISTSYRYR